MEGVYRGTSLLRKPTSLEPYRRHMPRVLGGSQGGGRFIMGEVTLNLKPGTYSPACSWMPFGIFHQKKFIDYKTSMITDSDPLRELLFY